MCQWRTCYSLDVAASSVTASRVETVTAKLRQDIFQGRYAPGSPLRELSLARELDVSQSTVREALLQLEHAGLITRKMNVGSIVTRLTPKQVKERVALRRQLEVQAALAASLVMKEAHFIELEARLKLLNDAVAADSYHEAAQADLNFHCYVWECSGNETLCRLLELITVPLFAFISILRSQGLQRLSSVVDAHGPLLEALRAGDPREITAAFERNATSSYRMFLDSEAPEAAVASAFGYLNSPLSDPHAREG